MRRIILYAVIIFFIAGIEACDSGVSNKSPNKSQRNTAVPFIPGSDLDKRGQQTIEAIIEMSSPPNIEAHATGVLTVINIGEPSIQNALGATELTNNAPLDGFPIGETIVTWSVTDQMGNNAITTQQIIIDATLACSTKVLFFRQRVLPIINDQCVSCHSDNIVISGLNFVDQNDPNYISKNFQEMENSAYLRDGSGNSLFLSKALNLNASHAGEKIIDVASPEYALLKSMVDRFSMCTTITALPAILEKLLPLQQLRKTTLSIANRIPKLNEVSQINQAISAVQIESAMRNVTMSLFNEQGFFRRLKIVYNDLLLTNAYSRSGKALGLNLENFDNKRYFGNTQLKDQGYDGTESNVLRASANYGVSQAPLELVKYVVSNDLPFTEILTADYVMVNPYSATLFGASIVGSPTFNFLYGENIAAHDKFEFVPAKLQDNTANNIPHAGLLTTIPFLSRYPSSNTNLNRKRAATVFKYFLGLDVEGLASRGGLDFNQLIGDFPTLQDPQCRVCHNVMDPVAGLFKNWGNNGKFLGDNAKWLDTRNPPQMLSPGFAGLELLPVDSAAALRWLASNISQDDRFSTATVRQIYHAFSAGTGELSIIQLQKFKTIFTESNFSLKSLIYAIVTDDVFLAANTNQPFVGVDFDDVGTANLLTPEQLHYRIKSIFNGYSWQSPGKRNLISEDTYRLLYGGIDSIDVISRTRRVTGIMAGVQLRLANQMACQLVPADFSIQKNSRILFPNVEITDVPDNLASAERIKSNIRYLFQRILGEEVLLESSDVQSVFNLFQASKNLIATEGIVRECRGELLVSDAIVIDSLQTVRAWTAIVNYLLRDYKFLYE